MADLKKALERRKEQKNKRPTFKREGNTKSVKFKKDTRWRRPKGRHSKLRHQTAGHAKKVMPGFRSERSVRGLHQSGLVSIIVHTPNDVAELDKNTQGAIVASTVGKRKKLIIIESLKKAGVALLNIKEDYLSKVEAELKQRKATKEERTVKKEKKAETKKKEEKKEEKKAETEEEKAAKEKQEKDKIITKAK